MTGGVDPVEGRGLRGGPCWDLRFREELAI